MIERHGLLLHRALLSLWFILHLFAPFESHLLQQRGNDGTAPSANVHSLIPQDCQRQRLFCDVFFKGSTSGKIDGGWMHLRGGADVDDSVPIADDDDDSAAMRGYRRTARGRTGISRQGNTGRGRGRGAGRGRGRGRGVGAGRLTEAQEREMREQSGGLGWVAREGEAPLDVGPQGTAGVQVRRDPNVRLRTLSQVPCSLPCVIALKILAPTVVFLHCLLDQFSEVLFCDT